MAAPVVDVKSKKKKKVTNSVHLYGSSECAELNVNDQQESEQVLKCKQSDAELNVVV